MVSKQPSLTDSNLPFAQRSELLLSAAMLAVLIVLLIPLPPMLIDALLATNISLTLMVLLVTLSARQPLEFSVFPSVLLLLTLIRLSLNVATTRQILLQGDAGRIVYTFGNFVVGGNLIVGLVVFLILVVIQFVVITRGAGRISEVAARFTLDALPGKQMAIDAELNAGLIDENEARRRRHLVMREAEFYGAMDGASKFVRGDAIAGLIITAVNLIGGMVIGLGDGLSFLEAIRTYSVLTVGDGLVSQIPALITATAAGMLITKASTSVSVAEELAEQVFLKPRALLTGAGLLGAIALTPGLPKVPFFLLAGGLGWAGWRLTQRRAEAAKQAEAQQKREPVAARPQEVKLEELLQHDRAAVEIGARLIPLVDPRRGTGLLERIAGLRRDMARKHGILVPPVRIRDNLELAPNQYRILINGYEEARYELYPDEMLAIETGSVQGKLDGRATREPAFGLPAYWIAPSEAQRAEMLGYTVVDPATVLVTHLGEVVRRHAHELLSREDVKRLVDKVKEASPTLVEELIPNLVTLSTVQQVLAGLLEEQVPITNLTRILESLAVHAPNIKDPVELVERVRVDLGRTICERFRTADGRVRAIVFDPRVELHFKQSLRGRQLVLEPSLMQRLIERLADELRKAVAADQEVAVAVEKQLRRPLRSLLVRALPDLAVIAYSEIPRELRLDTVAVITPEQLGIQAVAGDLPVEIERLLQQQGGNQAEAA